VPSCAATLVKGTGRAGHFSCGLLTQVSRERLAFIVLKAFACPLFCELVACPLFSTDLQHITASFLSARSHNYVTAGNSATIQMLIERDVSIRAKDKLGRTALQYACNEQGEWHPYCFSYYFLR